MNWKPFGYRGEPLTCLWCGKKLYYKKVLDRDREKELQAAGLSAYEAFNQALVKADKAGAYQDDSFCTASCGYLFGLRQAELGNRLKAPDQLSRKPVS